MLRAPFCVSQFVATFNAVVVSESGVTVDTPRGTKDSDAWKQLNAATIAIENFILIIYWVPVVYQEDCLKL